MSAKEFEILELVYWTSNEVSRKVKINKNMITKQQSTHPRYFETLGWVYRCIGDHDGKYWSKGRDNDMWFEKKDCQPSTEVAYLRQENTRLRAFIEDFKALRKLGSPVTEMIDKISSKI